MSVLISEKCKPCGLKMRLLGAPSIATRSKKLLEASGLTTRSKDATRGAFNILQSV